MKMRITVAVLMLALNMGAMAQGNRFAGVRGSVVGVTPCDTDTDCQEKNDAKPVYLCEAITKSGKRCTRHVNEPGLLCWQHSAMVKAGKTVKTVR